MDIIIELRGSKPYKIVPSQLTPKKFYFEKNELIQQPNLHKNYYRILCSMGFSFEVCSEELPKKC